MADAMEHEILLAGTGLGTPSQAYPKLLNALAGTKSRSSPVIQAQHRA